MEHTSSMHQSVILESSSLVVVLLSYGHILPAHYHLAGNDILLFIYLFILRFVEVFQSLSPLQMRRYHSMKFWWECCQRDTIMNCDKR